MWPMPISVALEMTKMSLPMKYGGCFCTSKFRKFLDFLTQKFKVKVNFHKIKKRSYCFLGSLLWKIANREKKKRAFIVPLAITKNTVY